MAGIDPHDGAVTRLFHPRRDDWNDHFRWKAAEIVPLSPIGRTTVSVLRLNEPEQIRMRANLAAESGHERGSR